MVIGYGYIGYQRFGAYSKCCHECVSNFNNNVHLWDIYPPIKLYCNVLGIDNVMLWFAAEIFIEYLISSHPYQGGTNILGYQQVAICY